MWISLLINLAFAEPCDIDSLVKAIKAEHSSFGRSHTVTYDYGKESAGILKYFWSPEAKKIQVEYLEVTSKLQRQGVSKRLYERMLQEHPDAKSIESKLTSDNFDAATQGKPPKTMALQECLTAVARTPAYKVRQALGFGRIIHCSYSAISKSIEIITAR